MLNIHLYDRPASVRSIKAAKYTEDGKVIQNGLDATEPSEVEVRQGEITYTKYYETQPELVPLPGQVKYSLMSIHTCTNHFRQPA